MTGFIKDVSQQQLRDNLQFCVSVAVVTCNPLSAMFLKYSAQKHIHRVANGIVNQLITLTGTLERQ